MENRAASTIYAIRIGPLKYETYRQQRHPLRVQSELSTEGRFLLLPLNEKTNLKVTHFGNNVNTKISHLIMYGLDLRLRFAPPTK